MKGGLAAYLLAAEALAAGVSRPARRPRLQLRDRGGVRRQRHVVRASRRLHGRRDAHRRADRARRRPRRHRRRLGYGSTARGAAGHSAYSGGERALRRARARGRRAPGARGGANEPPRDAVFAAVSDWPYGMTVGRIHGGVWTSSAPALLEVSVRFGLGLGDRPGRAAGADRRGRRRGRARRSRSSFEAFRARAYCYDTEGPLPELLLERRTRRDRLAGGTDRRSRPRPTPARSRARSATGRWPGASTAPTSGSTSHSLEQTRARRRAHRRCAGSTGE